MSQLKKLKALWYAKLKKSGFVDIERPDGQLIHWHGMHFNESHNGCDRVSIEHKAEYYRRAEHFLTNYKFDSETERQIWKFHSEGLGEIPMAKKLGLKRSTVVRPILKKLKILMKEYSKKELDEI